MKYFSTRSFNFGCCTFTLPFSTSMFSKEASVIYNLNSKPKILIFPPNDGGIDFTTQSRVVGEGELWEEGGETRV